MYKHLLLKQSHERQSTNILPSTRLVNISVPLSSHLPRLLTGASSSNGPRSGRAGTTTTTTSSGGASSRLRCLLLHAAKQAHDRQRQNDVPIPVQKAGFEPRLWLVVDSRDTPSPAAIALDVGTAEERVGIILGISSIPFQSRGRTLLGKDCRDGHHGFVGVERYRRFERHAAAAAVDLVLPPPREYRLRLFG